MYDGIIGVVETRRPATMPGERCEPDGWFLGLWFNAGRGESVNGGWETCVPVYVSAGRMGTPVTLWSDTGFDGSILHAVPDHTVLNGWALLIQQRSLWVGR